MHHSSANSSHRAAGSPLGAILFGFFGAATMATLILATGHGLVMAFLAYSLSGALFTVAAAAGRLVLNAAAKRLAPALGSRSRGALAPDCAHAAQHRSRR
jgi:hypothetical protein